MTDLSRRDFVTLSLGAGLAAVTCSVSGAELPVMETDLEVKTPDGTCDAAFIHPTTGSHPGITAAPLFTPGAMERDAVAHIAFLDAQPEVDKAKKIGTQGYCLGGPMVIRTAERVGAGASFHGGFLVTEKPDSPHLLAPKIKARMYFAIASDDDKREPDVKDKLEEAFAAAKVPAEIEVYPQALHGW